MCFANLLEGLSCGLPKEITDRLTEEEEKQPKGFSSSKLIRLQFVCSITQLLTFGENVWFDSRLSMSELKREKKKTWLTAYCYFLCDNELNGRFIDIFIGIYGKAYFKVVALIIVNVFKPFLIKKTIIFKSYCNVL